MGFYVIILKLFVHIVFFVDPVLVNPSLHHEAEKVNIIHGRYTRDITNFQLVVPKKVHPDGSFHTHHLKHYFKSSVREKRNLEDDRVHYLVLLNGQHHLLDLEPHAGVTAPSMVVERRAGGSNLSGTTFHKPQRHLCHFRGRVQGHHGSRVALSSCDGLVGYIRTQNGTYFVEPLHGESPAEGKEHVHVVYKRSLEDPVRSCGVKGGDWWSKWCALLHTSLETKTPHKRSEAGMSVQRWYEIMVVADKKFLMFHRDHDVEEYIICIVNIIADMYHDQSIGNLIDIVIVRIVYLEKEEDELDLAINTDGEDTLDSFCKWQYKMNFKDINHPNHHDVGVLFTRYDICADGDDTCSLLGLANLGTACHPELNCCINEDSGLILGMTTTHELGHTLGCAHDSKEDSGCEPIAPAGDSTVMNPAVQAQTSAWSPCSRSFVTGLFDSQMGECMLDEPQEHSFPLDEMPPGAFYDADQQCSFYFGPTFVHFDYGGDKFCEKLWCKNREGDSCTSMGDPPADGTKCGPNKWCFNKVCVEMGERPKAVNGEWGSWGSWTECSRTCGGGVSMRERQCDNPQPSNKGRYCTGKRHEYNICNVQECGPNSIPFRELQCAEFNDKPYQGMLHTWKAFAAPDNDPNPCALYCLNDARTFSKLAPRVKDGTRCKPGSKDTCVQGTCLAVGCDWKIGSDGVEDVCGICNGDGTRCTLIEGVFKDTPRKGYVPIITAPVGAVNVRLEEIKPSGNMVAVSAIDNKTFYLNGEYTEDGAGEYTFGGVKGIYLKPEMDMDELHIKGPLKEPLVLYICLFSNTNLGVRYSFAIPSEQPMYTPKYHWELVEWLPCSAQCGGGTQVMKAACVEERDGKVKDSFCSNLEKEEPRARTCNDQPCRTRWKVWKWGPCSGCIFKSGTRTRQVECVKQNPTNTGDEEIIAEPSECCGEAPKKSELCNSPRPCPKNMTSMIVKRTPIVVPIDKLIGKRSNEGKSFSDVSNSSTTPGFVEDRIKPDSIHLQEVLLEDNRLNLTEQEFIELGDEIPDKVLGCSVQELSGIAAMNRLEEIIHGAGYKKNATKIHQEHKNRHHTTASPHTSHHSTSGMGQTNSSNESAKSCKA